MKGLKKLALATAVAAAPFAQAELTAIDDTLLEEMTGQAGITIDVDLDMTIDAIKYVDQDGDQDGSGVQGSITASSLSIGADNGTDNWGAARIRGITIDADGTDGLVIGLNEIGDTAGNGIDIEVKAVLINAGNANLTAYNAINPVNAAMQSSFILSMDDIKAGTVATTLGTAMVTDVTAAATATPADLTAANTAATNAGFTDFNDMASAALTGDAAAQGEINTLAVGGNTVGQAAGAVLADASATADATEFDAFGQPVGTVAQAMAAQGKGNIGGFIIEDFRNYIQDDLVNKYNGVFDMALMDSEGAITGTVGAGDNNGRFVRGEITVSGTGNAVAGTSGLKIAGEFGGALDKAAWVDEGNEFGVADMGFFHGVDTNSDGIADTIEGMHFEMNIDVVQHRSWNATDIHSSEDVAALQISGLKMEGTIMMGELYLDGTNMVTADWDNDAGTADTTQDAISSQSLGSVLIKDINMEGTTVTIYGH